MKSKKGYLIIGLACISVACIAGVVMKVEEAKANKVVKIGVCVYKGTDTFVGSIVTEFEKIAKEEEQHSGRTIQVDVADAKEEQRLQNAQVERYIALDYDVICINLVDRRSASTLIDKANSAGIPIVFFNRQPVEEDMARNNQIYYVGSMPKESALLQGELIQEIYAKDPAKIDTNSNGVIEYAILEGESGHQDTIIRTEYAIKALEESGITLQKVTGWTANFDRSQAYALVDQWLVKDQNVELIIANNDDMALGAADAVKKHRKEGIKIVGIDGTPQGRTAVDEGVLSGTVVSNQNKYATVIFEICRTLLFEEGDMSRLELDEDKYYWVPWEKYVNTF